MDNITLLTNQVIIMKALVTLVIAYPHLVEQLKEQIRYSEERIKSLIS